MRHRAIPVLVSAALLLPGSSTLAQANLNPLPYPPLNQPRNITVLGQGQASAPADLARLEFLLVNRGSLNSFNNEAPDRVMPNRQPLQAAALQPIVSALEAIGIPNAAIAIQPSSVDSAELIVQVQKPTRQRVQQVVLTVNDAANQTNQLTLESIGAEYSVSNCQPLENTSRRAALNDAQRRIRALAAIAQVNLGELLQITEFPTSGSPSAFSRCGSKAGAPLNPLASTSNSTPPYDPAAPTEVRVFSQVSLTYAIAPQPE